MAAELSSGLRLILDTGFIDLREVTAQMKEIEVMNGLFLSGAQIRGALLAWLLVLSPSVMADAADEMQMTPTAKDMPTVVPSKQETAESVFAKLDAGKKGFISMADVTVLTGFDKVFQRADGDHDGKLSLKEFKGAWSVYSGTTDPIVDAPGIH